MTVSNLGSIFYNEIDPVAAAWLRNLIAAGAIAPGVVDERSIADIKPEELFQYVQCHFFAGIGVWSHALRRAGWADSRPVWTGSCPCQPFSTAGRGTGFDDERHLWPAFQHLIEQCGPPDVFGEQVASKDVDPWIDLVQDDLEGMDYAVAAVAFPSAGVGAPHIRDRTYWYATRRGGRILVPDDAALGVGDSYNARLERLAGNDGAAGRQGSCGSAASAGVSGGVGHADREPTRRDAGAVRGPQAGEGGGRRDHHADASGHAGGLADADSVLGGQGGALGRGRADGGDAQPRSGPCSECLLGGVADTGCERCGGRCGVQDRRLDDGSAAGRPQSDDGLVGDGQAGLRGGMRGPTNGPWRAADWLRCRDGKWRPVEPGTFPLAAGSPRRVGRDGPPWYTPAGPQGQGHRAGRLKAYGNAINAEAAQVFIECVMDVTPE